MHNLSSRLYNKCFYASGLHVVQYEHGDSYFLLPFSNIHNMITDWMKFEKFFKMLLLIKWNHLNEDLILSLGRVDCILSSASKAFSHRNPILTGDSRQSSVGVSTNIRISFGIFRSFGDTLEM